MLFNRFKKAADKSDDIGKIVASIQEGNSEAFSKLFNLCYNEVFGIAMSNVRNYDKACDITQETFVEIFNTIKSLRDPEAFHSWLKKITYHRCTNHFRSKEYKHEALTDETEGIDNLFETLEEDRVDFIPEASLDTKEFVRIIRTFIKDLPEAQRDAVVMYYFNDMPLVEIADIQGVPVDTVKSRLYYARKNLKNAIGEYEKDHDIKLHGIPLVPFLLQALEETETALTIESAELIAEGITTVTGAATSVATTSATTAVAGATAGGGIIASIKATPLVVKVVSTVAAISITATPVVIDFVNKNNSNIGYSQETTSIIMLDIDTVEQDIVKESFLDETTVQTATALETEPTTTAPETTTSLTEEVTIIPETTESATTVALCTHAKYPTGEGLNGDPYFVIGGFADAVPGVENRWTLLARCTEKRPVVYKCPQCLGGVLYEELDPIGHDFSGEEHVVLYPTLDREGNFGVSCQNYDKNICREVLITRSIPKRSGSYSTIDSCFTVDVGWHEYYEIEDPNICIMDCRTWGDVPTLTFNKETNRGYISFINKDGSIFERYFYVEPEYMAQGWTFVGELTEEGAFEESYNRLAFDGSTLQ